MTIGRIVVDLVARSGSFISDLDRASKHSQKSANEIERAFSNIGKRIGQTFVAIAGPAALGAMINSTMRQASEITKLAQLSGATTVEFQKLAAGAKMVGIEQDKLGDIFKDVQDKVGDFLQTGGGPMKDFFEQVAPKIGVTAEAFRNLSGPQALQLYVDSLQKAGLNQQQMTFYLEAIANDATALLPLLRDGGSGFQEWGDKAQRAGAVMRDETIAAARELEGRVAELTLQFDGWKNKIADEVLPRLVDLIDSSDELKTGFSDLLDTASRLAGFDGLSSFFDTLGDTAAGAIDYVAGATKQIAGLLSVAEGIKNLDLGRIQSGIADALGATPTTARDQYAARQAARIGPQLPAVTVTGTRLRPSSGGRTGTASSAVDEAAKARQQLDEMIAQALIRSDQALQQQAESWLDVIDPMRQYTRQLEEIRGLVSSGVFSAEQGILAEFEVEEARQRWLDSLGDIGDKAKETMSTVDEFALQAARNIQSVLGQGLYDIMDGNFDSIGDSFAQMIQRMTAEAMAAQLAGILFGDFGKSGSVGGLFGAGLQAIAGSLFGKRALGGPVTGGMPYLVGERGPELFVPNTTGKVLPNHALGNGGAVTVQSTINAAPGMNAAELRTYLDARDAQLTSTIVDGMRRGRYPVAN